LRTPNPPGKHREIASQLANLPVVAIAVLIIDTSGIKEVR
jgi:hypothetical protein